MEKTWVQIWSLYFVFIWGKLPVKSVYAFENGDRCQCSVCDQFEPPDFITPMGQADANSFQHLMSIRFTWTILKDIYSKALPDQLS